MLIENFIILSTTVYKLQQLVVVQYSLFKMISISEWMFKITKYVEKLYWKKTIYVESIIAIYKINIFKLLRV